MSPLQMEPQRTGEPKFSKNNKGCSCQGKE